MNYCDACVIISSESDHLVLNCLCCGCELDDPREDFFTIKCSCGEFTFVEIGDVKKKTINHMIQPSVRSKIDVYYGKCKHCGKENEITPKSFRQICYINLYK